MTSDSNQKGRAFEDEVGEILTGLAKAHPRFVTVDVKPRLKLQNDEVVIPDFHLTAELSHQHSHYLIECQSREKDSKSVLHKIQYIRAKQQWKTFLFLYPEEIAPELIRAFGSEGIMHLNLNGFQLFVTRLQAMIKVQPTIQPLSHKPDGAMLSSPPKYPRSW